VISSPNRKSREGDTMEKMSNREIGLFQEVKRSFEEHGFLVTDQGMDTYAPTFRYLHPGCRSAQEGHVRLDPDTRKVIMSMFLQTGLERFLFHIVNNETFSVWFDLNIPKEDQFQETPRRRKDKKPRMPNLHKPSRSRNVFPMSKVTYYQDENR
jgi:hypothetical protein